MAWRSVCLLHSGEGVTQWQMRDLSLFFLKTFNWPLLSRPWNERWQTAGLTEGFAFSPVEKVSRSDGWGAFLINLFKLFIICRIKSHLYCFLPSLKGKVANRRFDGRVLIIKNNPSVHFRDDFKTVSYRFFHREEGVFNGKIISEYHDLLLYFIKKITFGNIPKALWELQGSNLWHLACKASALPAELNSHVFNNV